MVTPDDIADGVRLHWGLTPTLNALIPNTRVYTGRLAERTAYPAAVLKIDEGPQELTSGAKYFARFTLTVEAYTNADPPNTGTIRGLLNGLLSGTPASPNAGLAVPNAVKVIHGKALAGGGSSVSTERIDGADVVKVAAKFDILVEGAH